MIDVNQVMTVYSGKRGCMCGCKGIYRTNSVFREEFLKTEKQEPTLNNPFVKKVVGILNAYPETEYENGSYYLELDGRIYVAYLAPQFIDS